MFKIKNPFQKKESFENIIVTEDDVEKFSGEELSVVITDTTINTLIESGPAILGYVETFWSDDELTAVVVKDDIMKVQMSIADVNALEYLYTSDHDFRKTMYKKLEKLLFEFLEHNRTEEEWDAVKSIVCSHPRYLKRADFSTDSVLDALFEENDR